MVDKTFFNMGVRKAKYIVQIIEKLQGNCRTCCETIDFGDSVFGRKRETE